MGLLRLLGIEKYLRKVKTYVDEKMAIPNWNAKDGEKGYIKNRTHYKDYGVWNDVNISVSGNTATISNIDMYEYIVFKTNDSGFYSEPVDLTVNTRHNVSFDGVSGIVQVTVIPAENIIKVVANNVADIKALIKEGIKPYIVITLSPEYLPEGLATKEYVAEKVGEIGTIPEPLFEAGRGEMSIAQKGTEAEASEEGAIAFGVNTIASGPYSFAQGNGTKAEEPYCHAEGYESVASATGAHAEGGCYFYDESKDDDVYLSGGYAMGRASHAEGVETKAKGMASHAEGIGTVTSNDGEHAEGEYNYSQKGVTVHSVGVGLSDTKRKNAHEIDMAGKNYFLGLGDYDGTNADTGDCYDLVSVINRMQRYIEELEERIQNIEDNL